MKRFLIGVFALIGVLVVFNSMSKGHKELRNDCSSEKRLNYIDTVFYNDSVFTIMTYVDGQLQRLNLKQFVGNTKRSFGIHEISFWENGKINYVETQYRDTMINNHFKYEEQRLLFDLEGKLQEYYLIDDFKDVAKSAEK